jgi:predicted AAA+ superfamily ATPase
VHTRNDYIKKIKPFIRKPVIKVITGMRRVGKSFFLRQLIEILQKDGIPQKNILYIDKESLEFDFIQNYKGLDQYINSKFSGIQGETFLFIDEIQEIHQWEKTINSILNKGQTDIYITGSNAHLFSSEMATLISGRYIEFPIYGLSFKEFLVFRGSNKQDIATEFQHYLRYGGLPGLHHFDFMEGSIFQYLSSIYDTILLKDIIKRHNIRNVHLLENINKYIFDNIGNIFSAKKVSDYLKSQRLRIGVDTVQSYISYFLSTFSAYKVPRFDVKGKRILEFNEKYFVGDIGIRHAALSYREADISGLLENMVFLELKRRNFKIFIGKLGEKEIDFIAEKAGKRVYLQVAYLLESPLTIEREFYPLKQIKDNYPKYVLSMDRFLKKDFEGITRLNIIDFLLSEEDI